MKILLRKRQIFSSFKPLHEITLDVIIVLNSSFPTLQISGNRTVKKWNDDLFNDLFQAFIRFFFKGKKTHPSLSLSLSLHSKTKIPGNPPPLAKRRDEYFQSWNGVLPRRGFVASRWRVRVFPKGVFQSALTSVTVSNRRQPRRRQADWQLHLNISLL